MKRLPFILALAASAWGATYTVSQNSFSACSTAIASCAPYGDTVALPSGTITIPRQLVISKALVLKGRGDNRLKTSDSTKLLITWTTAWQGAIGISGTGDNLMRITGVIFEKDTTVNTLCNHIQVAGPATRFIVDTCKFQFAALGKIGSPIVGYGRIFALIHSCGFYRINADDLQFAYGEGVPAWHRSNLYGTRDQIVIEDCARRCLRNPRPDGLCWSGTRRRDCSS